jgi:hypothetical protein
MKRERLLRDNMIYKAKRGHVYDPELKRYNCYRPAHTGVYSVQDMWVCDEQGRIHPGYNASPVPVIVSDLGDCVNVIR